MPEQETDASTTSVNSKQVSSTRRPQWLALAIGSGAFAAFNGVFAKLYVRATRGETY